MKTEGLSFPEAVRMLAERAHIELHEDNRPFGVGVGRKARLKAVCAETASYYHTQLMRSAASDAAAARAYLSGRGLGGKVPGDWQLGFAPGRGELMRHLLAHGFSTDEMIQANVAFKGRDGKVRDRFYNRVMFPIHDEAGECIAFGGRVVGTGEPKYLNSQETPLFHKGRVLYALDKAKAEMASTGVAIVSEGYTDVIAMHEAGVKNAVATLGTALTRQHIRTLSRHAQKRIVYLFDGDAAGQRAADRALQFIDATMNFDSGRMRVELAAVTLPDNLDPAEYLGKHSADDLRACIAGAKPLIEYGIDRRLAKWDLARPEGRAGALADAISVLAPIKDTLLAKDYAVRIASLVRAREEDVLDELSRLKAPQGAAGTEPGQRVSRSFSPSAAPTVATVAPGTQVPLTPVERNRRRIEGRLLALTASRPDLALLHADALAQTQWHSTVARGIAQSMLDTLSADPAATSAQIVGAASRVHPAAANVLTSANAAGDAASEVEFLVEELSIGDAEDAVAGLRAQLADPQSLSPDDYEILYETVASMQKDIVRRRSKMGMSQ